MRLVVGVALMVAGVGHVVVGTVGGALGYPLVANVALTLYLLHTLAGVTLIGVEMWAARPR